MTSPTQPESSPPRSENPSQPVRVTFVTWDAATDGVAVLHDGEQVWQESTFDKLDQYLKFVAPVGQPVIIDHLVRDEPTDD